MAFRLGVIADIHHGADTQTKRGTTALDLLARFVDWANGSALDAVLDLGDRISDVDTQTDAELLREVVALFDRLEVPHYHLDGNHDLDFLSRHDNNTILGRRDHQGVVAAGEWGLVLWQPGPSLYHDGKKGLRMAPEELAWLKEHVEQADRPLLVASHVPISPMAMTGNYYFEHQPHCAVYPEAPQARAILAQARVPVVCLSGHVHWNALTFENGIAYLAQQSLTESFTTGGTAAAAWGLLELDQSVRWEVMGRDRFSAQIFPSPERWTPPYARRGVATTAGGEQ